VRLTAELLEGFTLSDGTPLPVGTYRFDAEGRLIYPPEPEPETEPETDPETHPETESADTNESDPETDPSESAPETEAEKETRYSSPTVGVMGLVGIFVTVLAIVTVACLRKREETAG